MLQLVRKYEDNWITEMLKNLIIVFFTIILTIGHVFSFDLDMTVDDDIRKNYNSSKLIRDTKTEGESLPALPDKLKNNSVSNHDAVKTKNLQHNIPAKTIYQGNIKVKKGTSFDVVNTAQISDWQTKGTTVTFKTKTAVNKKKYSIPTGTIFYGEIVDSHKPQLTCNGGLIVIKIKSMVYKGETIPVNAYITRANDKLIFLNNIKGERTFLKTMWTKGNWGRTIFNKMLTLTISLGGDGSTVLLSPFPALYGTLCLGLNTLTSPVCAFFSKGKHLSIPAGKNFRIKLLNDAYVY